MKIGIVGSAERAAAWEEHLRPHQSVSEVVLSAKLQGIGDVDACLIIDETEQNLEQLLAAIKMGYHVFLIAKLPVRKEMIEKVYHSAEEANVLVQFSHWPTLAPASQWMMQRIQKPNFVQVNREISYTDFLEMERELDDFWIDELAFCLKWIGGAVHHIDIKKTDITATDSCAIHLFLRFNSGATAGIYVYTCALENRHRRIAANHTQLTDCDVISQRVRLGKPGQADTVYFESKTFDPSRAAELGVTRFLKSVQINKPTLFNAFDALQLCNTLERVKKRMIRI